MITMIMIMIIIIMIMLIFFQFHRLGESNQIVFHRVFKIKWQLISDFSTADGWSTIVTTFPDCQSVAQIIFRGNDDDDEEQAS